MAEQGAFSSVWAQESNYWIVVEGHAATTLPGFVPMGQKTDMAARCTGPDWAELFHACAEMIMQQRGGSTGYRCAILPAEQLPALPEVIAALRPFNEVGAITTHLWLIDALRDGELDCYMQRVVDRRGEPVGFEALARMQTTDGGVVGGGAIMKAAHGLRVEYQLDRVMHRRAVERFVSSNLPGYLFINFLTGFIHRPEVYLEGLSQAVTRARMRPALVVLDVPLADYVKDMAKLKSIAQYCRSRGFSLALTGVCASEGLAALLADIRPAFVKLPATFGQDLTPVRQQAMLYEIVRTSHAYGIPVLAEGVETQAQHERYHAAGVDLFQGYFFGAPERFMAQPAEETVS